MQYLGVRRTVYTLETKLAAGGEGTVYTLAGNPDTVAKIYKPDHFKTEEERNKMCRKLTAMIATNIPVKVDGFLRLAWPQDILFENGRMVGFTMPKIHSSLKIFDIYRGGKNSKRAQYYPNYNWKHALQFSYNLAWIVNYLHEKNIVIGDFNQNNIIVDHSMGNLILIDCDSFDIRDPKTGEHFPCTVALPEILAPELQTISNFQQSAFTKYSDYFALAVHIFRLLMDNNDPFGGRITNNASMSQIPANQAIINGECPYVRTLPNKVIPPFAPSLSILPADLQNLFTRTFHYTALTVKKKMTGRATAKEWCLTLLKYADGRTSPQYLKTCPNHHVYSGHNTSCPWCELERRQLAPPQPVPSPKPAPPKPAPPKPAPRPAPSRPKPQPRPQAAVQPVARRSAGLLYGLYILAGLALGPAYGGQLALELSTAPQFCTLLLSVAGLIIGFCLSKQNRQKYMMADNPLRFIFGPLYLLLAPFFLLMIFFGEISFWTMLCFLVLLFIAFLFIFVD